MNRARPLRRRLVAPPGRLGSLPDRLAPLFPPAAKCPWPRPAAALGYLAAFAAASALALLRQPGLAPTSTLWAEDGRIFYAQALRMPFFATLVHLHDGYAQLFPRLAGQLARLAPPGDAALVLALAGAASTGALACLVFHMAKGHVPSPLLRAVLAGSMVLLPVANVELLDNVVNVPWWLFFATFWALLWRPRSAGGRAGAGTVCALAAASQPLAAVLLPLGAARLIALGGAGARRAGPGAGGGWRRWLGEHSPTAGLVLGLAYQWAVISLSPHAGVLGRSQGSLAGIARSFAVRAGLGLVAGVKGTDWLLAHDAGLAVALGAAAIGVLALAGLLARSAGARAFTVVATACSFGAFAAAVWLRGLDQVTSPLRVQVGSRYEAVPLMLLLSGVVVVAGHWASHWESRRESRRTLRRWPSAGRASLAASSVATGRAPRARPGASAYPWLAGLACTALLVPSWAADFRDNNQRELGPSWKAQVARASSECKSGGAAPAVLSLAIDPPGWTASLPCRVLAPTVAASGGG
ncbi:MAG: hypothetical protein ACRDZX_17280 [Acidimicrobiales bacterium]